jgi:type IV secretory pathway VirD2 relaxase
MKKEELLAKLEVAKEVTSVVSIDLIISALNELELPTKTGITQELADEIANKIERTLDYNSNDLVNKDDVTFNINYGNTIEVDDVYIDVYETMDHINSCLSEFIIEEGMEEIIQDEDVIEVSNETGYTLPGFENGSGIDQVTIY